VEALEHGRGYDRFRQSVYEAAALGVSMSLPYGSWMGSVIEDAFYPPPELCTEIGGFLHEHEGLYSARTWSETGVIYSVESNFRAMARRDLFQDNRTNIRRDVAVPFWEVSDALSDAAQPYDVLFFPDGELRADTLTADDLAQYRVLVAPAVTYLTQAQARLLEAFTDRGGQLVVLGPFGSNLDPRRRERLLSHAGTTLATGAFGTEMLPFGPQVKIPGDMRADLALTLQRVQRGVAIHIIRYDHDDDADRVPPLPEIALDVRLPASFRTAAAAGTSGDAGARVGPAPGGWHRVQVSNVPLYTIVVLEP
jgi:hypothetical protein